MVVGFSILLFPSISLRTCQRNGHNSLLLLEQVDEDGMKSIGYSLWKDENESLQWLDTKEPKSAVYVNFGSIIVMTAEQLVEFAMGLADSNHSFSWIIRPDLVIGDSAILPAEFEVDIQIRGFIASWFLKRKCSNIHQLAHFLTHSGRGSTIESLSAGVPMACWPFFAGQK
jgi:UDP:flavonoid glycosyltransferase YjiC (YdhE family)